MNKTQICQNASVPALLFLLVSYSLPVTLHKETYKLHSNSHHTL